MTMAIFPCGNFPTWKLWQNLQKSFLISWNSPDWPGRLHSRPKPEGIELDLLIKQSIMIIMIIMVIVKIMIIFMMIIIIVITFIIVMIIMMIIIIIMIMMMIIIIVMIIMMMFIAKVTDFDYEGTRQESHSNPWGTGDQAR